MSAFGAVADPVAARVPGLQLHLTAEEQQLFDLLLKSVAFNGKNSTLRVAGGWVRDRILEKDSNDIDIALDDQSGIEFANGVNAYLQSLGMETRTIAVIMVRTALSSIFTYTGGLMKHYRRIPTNQNTWRLRTCEF